MWWLSFRDGSAVVIDASSLVHARLLAAAQGLGRVSDFVAGLFTDSEHAALIPYDCRNRLLSPIEARQLHERLKRDLTIFALATKLRSSLAAVPGRH
jgi:hypothetical protein